VACILLAEDNLLENCNGVSVCIKQGTLTERVHRVQEVCTVHRGVSCVLFR
jgi:hypothetical protein